MVSHGEKLCTKLESLAETNTECDISEGVEGREVGGEEGGRGGGGRGEEWEGLNPLFQSSRAAPSTSSVRQ